MVNVDNIINFVTDKVTGKSYTESMRGPVQWNNYSVYIPVNKVMDGKTPIIGLPQYIMEKDGDLRWSTMEEAFAIHGDFGSEEYKRKIKNSQLIELRQA